MSIDRDQEVVLSPSQLTMWLRSEEDYYIRYFLKEREAQTPAMAVGSAFDSFVKAELLAKDGEDKKKLFATFIRSVEPQCYEEAVGAGAAVFMAYIHSGAFDALKRDLRGHTVRCEERVVTTIGGIKLNCVADLFTDTVVHDWKVNGYYSSGRPEQGYLRMWKDGNNKATDQRFEIMDDRSIPPWNIQLRTYALVHKAEQIWVDQIIYPGPRVAQYRYMVGENRVLELYGRLMEAWDRWKKTGVFLTDKSRQDALDLRAI